MDAICINFFATIIAINIFIDIISHWDTFSELNRETKVLLFLTFEIHILHNLLAESIVWAFFHCLQWYIYPFCLKVALGMLHLYLTRPFIKVIVIKMQKSRLSKSWVWLSEWNVKKYLPFHLGHSCISMTPLQLYHVYPFCALTSWR